MKLRDLERHLIAHGAHKVAEGGKSERSAGNSTSRSPNRHAAHQLRRTRIPLGGISEIRTPPAPVLARNGVETGGGCMPDREEMLCELLLSDPEVASWLELDEDESPAPRVPYDEGAGG